MELYKTLDMLGRAFSNGEIDALAGLLNENCRYNSDYAHRRLTSAEDILENMRAVYESVRKHVESGDNIAYSYKIVQLDSVFKDGIELKDLSDTPLFRVYEKCLLLFQYISEEPVAVVFIKTTPTGYVTEINLSRNPNWFDLNFYDKDRLEDSEKDIPYTVIPMSSHDRQVQEMQAFFTHQNHDYEELDDSEVYIWREADKYIKQWLADNGYYVIESQIFDDCIGYRCSRNSYAYTVYMYAYGRKKTTQLDGDYCAKLLDNKLSANSTVFVVYLNVKRFKDEDEIKYSVCDHSGDEDQPIYLWRVNKIGEKTFLELYPRKEMLDVTYRFMYAFNRDNRDVYDCIMGNADPVFRGLDPSGVFANDAFYLNIFRLHKEYGDMKIGYVRFNDVIYGMVPYIEGYGYFSLSIDNSTDKILEVSAVPFDGGECKVADFIKTDERESDEWYADVPTAVSVKTLAPVFTERFAFKLTFDNGECKKYVLPIDEESENDEAVAFDSHVFTDKIWATAKIIKSKEAHRGMAVRFANEYALSGLKCYEEGTPYAEPEICGELVYEDENYAVEKCWSWKVGSIYKSGEPGTFKAFSGRTFGNYSFAAFASRDGKRLCSIDFDYIDNFHEGLARISKPGYGYGFVDRDMHLAIPMIYDEADNFKNGTARVSRNGKWFYIDKAGEETEIHPTPPDLKYQDVGEFREGMCKVSTLKLSLSDLAYYTDYWEVAGQWGFIDESGEEVIAPQYIYAEDFHGGIALVCKGEWTIDKKWDNKYRTGCYWSEEQLWGAIDKDGNEVIPFIFDEIRYFLDFGRVTVDSDEVPVAIDDVLMAHYGGWDDGHWGIIDDRGNWLVEPVFDNIDDEYHDGLFVFYEGNGYISFDVPLGIYDMKQKRVIFEPQFLSVDFLDDGWIIVEVFDKELGRNVEKLIDRNGNEKFHSIYSSISSCGEAYKVSIRDEEDYRHGVIDKDGNIILPCEHDILWDGIYYKQKLVVFLDGEHQGIRDFAGNVILEPKYYEIGGIDRPMFVVKVGEKDNYKEGLVSRTGKDVIPADFKRIRWLEDNYFVCCKDDSCEIYRLINKP